MARRLTWADLIVLVYLGATGLFLLAGAPEESIYRACAVSHFVLAASIGTLLYLHSKTGGLGWLRRVYPLLLLGPIYCEVDLYARLMFDGATFDAVVRQWDVWLFGFHPHQHLASVLSGPFCQELLHAFYLSYYALLGGSYLWVMHRRPDDLPRFAFVFMGIYLSFMALFMAFPVVGPMAHRGAHFTSTGLFTYLVDILYGAGEPGGIWTGAFPSSHVGMSVGVVLLLRPKRWWSRVVLWTAVAGIAISTTYGWFHYAIDAVTGAGAGLVLFVGWNYLYHALPAPSSVAQPAPSYKPSRESPLREDLAS